MADIRHRAAAKQGRIVIVSGLKAALAHALAELSDQEEEVSSATTGGQTGAGGEVGMARSKRLTPRR